MPLFLPFFIILGLIVAEYPQVFTLASYGFLYQIVFSIIVSELEFTVLFGFSHLNRLYLVKADECNIIGGLLIIYFEGVF